MRAAVLTLPGSNGDRDLAVAFAAAGFEVTRVWHKESVLPEGADVVGTPGGFSFGDYLRCGAIAARAPIMAAVANHTARGGYVLGICNGFQVVAETGLLPGALMRNANLKFICKPVEMTVETTDSAFLAGYKPGANVVYPVAHHDGNYTADSETLDRVEGEGRVALRYVDNPNGSDRDIAGVLSENRRVLGMMPHPERVVDAALGGTDGAPLFSALLDSFATA